MNGTMSMKQFAAIIEKKKEELKRQMEIEKLRKEEEDRIKAEAAAAAAAAQKAAQEAAIREVKIYPSMSYVTHNSSLFHAGQWCANPNPDFILTAI